MKRLRDLPIRRKLALIIVVTCALSLLLAAITIAILDTVETRRTMTRDITVLADVIARNTQASLAFNDPDSAGETLRALESEPSIERATIYDADGKAFVQYKRAENGRRAPGVLTVSRPVNVSGTHFGRIEVTASTRRLVDRLRNIAAIGAVVLLGSLLIAVAVSRRMRTMITEPILALTTTSREITERGDFTVRATRVGDDEIGEMTSAFNQMLDALEQRGRSLAELNEVLELRVHERTEQLQRANEELESFSYSVSHDLRAPLRAVDGYARMLEEDHGPVLDDDGRRLLSVVREEARRMGTLIDDLLDFSRFSRQPLKPSPLDLEPMATTIISDLRRTRPDREIAFTCNSLPTALADASTMRQVLINLLSNAVKYAKSEGMIQVELGGRREGAMNTYWVKDHGVGFDMRYVNKIFGVFQRLHGAEFEGTGVGLAIVERIVLRHGGEVRAEGALGQGACFHFTLPAADAAAESRKADE